MPKLVVITPKKLIQLLHQLGFEERDAQGSHVLYRHPDGRTTTVAVKSKEIGRGLLRKILRDIVCQLQSMMNCARNYNHTMTTLIAI